MTAESAYLTPGELASHLKIKTGTVALWTRQGRIPATRLSRKVVRYRLPEVMEALIHADTRSEREPDVS